MKHIKESIFELIKKTSTVIPDDVIKTIFEASDTEEEGSPSKMVMETIKKNINLANEKSLPICQDTGSLLFFIKPTKGLDKEVLISKANEAVKSATELGILRENSVDPLTGKNTDNNLGPGTPAYFFSDSYSSSLDIRLILKGGGCENVGAQYSLPDEKLNAKRDIEGVKKVILDAVTRAQGKGCAPGFLGVAVGGDRATSYLLSKEQFLRSVQDENPDSELAKLENEIINKSNKLQIGPMGFGGKNTILGCKIGTFNRLPASYFVTISYMCWAFRRNGIIVDDNGNIKRWLY